jgi:hypothetical protein
MNDRFTEAVSEILRSGGWFEGRSVRVVATSMPPDFAMFSQARAVLAEFGGLHFGQSGRGINCATNDVDITTRATNHVVSDLKKYTEILRVRLYPIGHVQLEHWFLVIDEIGRVYILNDRLFRLAPTFDRALELLLLGKRPDLVEIAATWGANAGAEVRLDTELKDEETRH